MQLSGLSRSDAGTDAGERTLAVRLVGDVLSRGVVALFWTAPCCLLTDDNVCWSAAADGGGGDDDDDDEAVEDVGRSGAEQRAKCLVAA